MLNIPIIYYAGSKHVLHAILRSIQVRQKNAAAFNRKGGHIPYNCYFYREISNST